jgi:hypothetical protein
LLLLLVLYFFLLSSYQNFHVKWVGIILDKIYPTWCC